MIREICILEREKEREGGRKEKLDPKLKQPQGIYFLQRGMEKPGTVACAVILATGTVEIGCLRW
jgi:hypothetical protein